MEVDYILVSEKDFNSARKAIRESPKGKPVVFASDNDELNRKVLEKENISCLLIFQKGRKDNLKQRNSGFNQVMAKLAKKRGSRIGICLNEIIGSEGKEKADLLARARQNIMLCSKDRILMWFFPGGRKDLYDLKALGLVLGMPTWMTKAL